MLADVIAINEIEVVSIIETKAVRFDLVVNKIYEPKDYIDESSIISVVAFGNTAEFILNHLSENDLILLEGSIFINESIQDMQNKYEIFAEKVEVVSEKCASFS
jgi:single-stranded DNA-binding protein